MNTSYSGGNMHEFCYDHIAEARSLKESMK